MRTPRIVGLAALALGGGALVYLGVSSALAEQRYAANATVLESPKHGPELCVGGVLTSLPPQCGGPPITNWDWDAVAGEESRGGTTWTQVYVEGTYDGERFTLTADPSAPRPRDEPEKDFSDACAWAIRADVSAGRAADLSRLLAEEPPAADLRSEPFHAARYESMGRVECGPAFSFPDDIVPPSDVVILEDARSVGTAHFQWLEDELSERSPAAVVVENAQVVSVCCCARLSDEAAEASLYTAPGFRGQGHAQRVTAAWALAVRAIGRIPLYSTTWTNDASRAVAAKLGLLAYASDISVYDEPI